MIKPRVVAARPRPRSPKRPMTCTTTQPKGTGPALARGGQKTRGTMRKLEGVGAGGGRKEVKKRAKIRIIHFSPTTHHSQVSQPHLALLRPPPTKLGEAKPARTPVCASGCDTVPQDLKMHQNHEEMDNTGD